ncbi:MAG: hypothetical protein AB1665_08735 [Candidatus Thermoplasmatota archaeon]
MQFSKQRGDGVCVNIDAEIVQFMKPLFGDMAESTINVQKEKLGLRKDELTYEEYMKVVRSIVALCHRMAGAAIASKIEDGLVRILNEAKAS